MTYYAYFIGIIYFTLMFGWFLLLSLLYVSTIIDFIVSESLVIGMY